jgi:hypothetical protein
MTSWGRSPSIYKKAALPILISNINTVQQSKKTDTEPIQPPSLYKKPIEPTIKPVERERPKIYDPNSLESPSMFKKVYHPLHSYNTVSDQSDDTSDTNSVQSENTSDTNSVQSENTSNINSIKTILPPVSVTKNIQEDIEILKNVSKLKKRIEELDKKIDFTNTSSSWNKITDESKICISVLTRGYTNSNKYYKLIERNKCIEKRISSKKVDILIFHEGNISPNQQTYISTKTPSLSIKFVDITTHAFKKEKETIEIDDDTKSFTLGYRHMCSFWFIDFWNFVEEYDYLIRIDEDCFVMFDPLSMIISLKDYNFVSGIYDKDEPYVTKGLNEFTLSFIKKNDTYSFIEMEPKQPGGPYTNLFGIALHAIRNNFILYRYQTDVSDSNAIYQYRWGDLPLWGEVIHYIFGDKSLLLDENLIYFHESHDKNINAIL